ncbi:MAG: hypothetical protein PHD04_03490 [Candidatus Pacebacteria bacterium]|nr:hypothetical protein [Candidatus Paceibacterota bacterium]
MKSEFNDRERAIICALLIHSGEVLSSKMRVFDRRKCKWLNVSADELMVLAEKSRGKEKQNQEEKA